MNKIIMAISLMVVLSTYGILANSSNNSDGLNSNIPKMCSLWYDGCNECTVIDGKITSCTEKACIRQSQPKCLAYSDSRSSSGCKLFYDGCNTCLFDKNGEIGKCTDKVCIKYETPKCIDDKYPTPTKETGPVKIPEKKEEYLCGGCTLDDKCYPFGYRKSGTFCSDAGYAFIAQKQSDISCDNNFECSSNLCISGKCISQSLIDKILSWFKSFFG